MKKGSLIYLLMIIVLTTVSCGPRRYKCGPYRKCENSKEKIKNNIIYKEFDKTYSC